MSDDRQGLPSASNIHRLAACPGSHRMCAGLPNTPTVESEFGTRVHAYLAGKVYADPLGMSPEELEIAESCQEIEARVVAEWKARNQIPEGDGPAIQIVRDSERWWLELGGEKACSGVTDVAYLWGRHALILDYKALPGVHGEAVENLQLRCLAVLAMEKFGWLVSADVAIIQPLKTHTPMVCHYDVDGLIHAQKELHSILEAVNAPNAPLHAGDHCKYCRAASICPEVRKEVETLSALTIHENGLTVPDEDMARLLGKCGTASKMIASIKAECFRRAEADPEGWRSMGFEIREGVGKRTVENVSTVGERLNAAGASWQDISAECSITIKFVETLARKATGLKGMALKKAADAILEGCCAVKKAKPSLKKIGAQEDDE